MARQARIGVIGAGIIAGRHVSNLSRFDDVKLMAVADLDVARAETLARQCGARAYSSAEQMLDAEQLEAVYVCVPPFGHGAPEAAVMERGLPFFVEKPIAADLETAERIADEVARRQLITGTGYHWRYVDVIERAVDLVRQNPPRLALGYWLDFTPPPTWWTQESLSGGQMIEQTTHVFDLARLLVGEVTRVHAVAARSDRPAFPQADICDVSSATLQFASGAIGNVASTCLLDYPYRVGLHLFCEGVVMEVGEFELMIGRAAERTILKAQGDPFVREDRDFVDAVLGKPNRIRVPYAEALKTHQLATAAARSAREERPIDLVRTGATA